MCSYCGCQSISLIGRLMAEHDSLDELADRIRAGEYGLIHDFVELLRDHMAKEDNGLFPAAAIELDGPHWEEAIDLTTPAGAPEGYHPG